MLRFIGGMGSGGMMTSHHDIRVQVTHVLSEGYLPSFDGGTIKEEMPLREFLGRIFREDPRSVENELYRVSKCLAGGHYYNNDEISRISHKYDAMYSELIRKGKLVLPQHKHIGGIDPYHDQKAMMAQKSAMDYHQESFLRQAAVFAPPSRGILDSGPSKADRTLLEQRKAKEEKRKRDEDLFFLLT